MDDKKVPVLFLIFNRPENTQKVFEAIRKQQPKYLFIAADGPRDDKPGEEALCLLTRAIAIKIDWDCEVKTLFRTQNLGCKVAVSSAISWFFDQIDEGIILEDDCLPDATFFPFCAELLEKYRDDKKVMSISGSNLLGQSAYAQIQSYFSGHGGIWGWATWKRAWNHYDINMKAWPEEQTKEKIKLAIGTSEWYQSYYFMFESSHNKSLDTWDIQWFYSILVNNGIAINSSVNLVKNIGFDAGTHSNSADNPIVSLPLYAMSFPLKHANDLSLDVAYLKAMYNAVNIWPKNKRSIIKRAFNLLQNK
jgi:hypothetical protein